MDDDLNAQWLNAMGLAEDGEASAALAELNSTPVPIELYRRLQTRLDVLLPKSVDPAFVLRSLQQFISASRSPTALLALFERDDHALETLLRMLGAGQRMTSWLIADPESFDLVRASDGAEASREMLIDEITAEIETLASLSDDSEAAGRVLRSVFNRERLRIAYADFVFQVAPNRIAFQLTSLADAIIESTTQFVRNRLVKQFGQPRTPNGNVGRFAIVGLGPLGGQEMSYDSALDLVFLCDLCEPTDGEKNIAADEFFDRLGQGVLELLDFYNVGSSHRPLTDDGSLALTMTEAYRHYQLIGRTWERLLYVKSRCLAGDTGLGNEFLRLMEPWVYRRYLERADLEGMHTIARKVSRRIDEAVKPIALASQSSVLTCPGGLADLDTVIGVLQLINGGDLAELRVRSTSEAIAALRRANCLSLQEATLLSDHWALLRRYLHCCQAESPINVDDLKSEDYAAANESAAARQRARIAWHLGYRNENQRGDVTRLDDAVESALRLNRTIMRHLLRDAADENEMVPPETELVLDPAPEEALIQSTMQQHRMSDAMRAMHDLQRLADEPVPFLSSRRCRHFLATIAPALLAEIGRTPDPHATLATLVEVSDSLGGKAVLWELFRATPSAMRLVVRLCACSPYLSRILIHNPGMIDELVDSLLLDRLPSERWLEHSSLELCRGAVEIAPIIASFKNGAHLQIGVRDVLGKEPLEKTHAALATTAESVLRRIAESASRTLSDRFGDPVQTDGQAIELVMLGLGKLGACEPNYFSDLDVQFLYTDEGNTRRRVGGHRTTTTALHFFNAQARQIMQRINQPSEGTRLYELGSSLGIHHSSSSPALTALSLDALAGFFRRGEATWWQRLSLCKSRPISGSPAARERVQTLIRELLAGTEWYPSMATQIRQRRLAIEQAATDDNLRSAPGGTVDVEWATQALQLRYAATHPELLVPGTVDALQGLSSAGLIDPAIAAAMILNYRTLREIESKLCLLDTAHRHEIPEDDAALGRLAFLMNETNGKAILENSRQCRAANRRMFNQVMSKLGSSGS